MTDKEIFARKIIEVIDAVGDDNLDTITTIENLCKMAIEESGKVGEDLDREIKRYEEIFKHCPACMEYKETARHFAEWQRLKDREGIKLLKEWFEDIAEKCEHLTSANVSHNGKMIRGFARNCAEYIKTDLL